MSDEINMKKNDYIVVVTETGDFRGKLHTISPDSVIMKEVVYLKNGLLLPGLKVFFRDNILSVKLFKSNEDMSEKKKVDSRSLQPMATSNSNESSSPSHNTNMLDRLTDIYKAFEKSGKQDFLLFEECNEDYNTCLSRLECVEKFSVAFFYTQDNKKISWMTIDTGIGCTLLYNVILLGDGMFQKGFKFLFESLEVMKVMYDGRLACHILTNHHHIIANNVLDLCAINGVLKSNKNHNNTNLKYKNNNSRNLNDTNNRYNNNRNNKVNSNNNTNYNNTNYSNNNTNSNYNKTNINNNNKNSNNSNHSRDISFNITSLNLNSLPKLSSSSFTYKHSSNFINLIKSYMRNDSKEADLLESANEFVRDYDNFFNLYKPIKNTKDNSNNNNVMTKRNMNNNSQVRYNYGYYDNNSNNCSGNNVQKNVDNQDVINQTIIQTMILQTTLLTRMEVKMMKGVMKSLVEISKVLVDSRDDNCGDEDDYGEDYDEEGEYYDGNDDGGRYNREEEHDDDDKGEDVISL